MTKHRFAIFQCDAPELILVFPGRSLRVDFAPPRTWRELAAEAAGLEPGRALYEGVGAGTMREIAALKSRQLNEAARGTAT